MNNFEKNVLREIEQRQLLSKGDGVIVALSGGADSVCLAMTLLAIAKELELSLFAFHLNHNIRGESAKSDANFCVEFCEKNKIKLQLVSLDVPNFARENKMTVEEAGRTLRYRELRNYSMKIQSEYGIPVKIAVAHHKNDLAENVIFHEIRGTGLFGLNGMPQVRGDIIRPLLSVTRDEIEKYLEEKKQHFCVDETNFDTAYARNSIRQEILPAMEKINNRVVDHLFALSKESVELEDYLSEQIASFEGCVFTRIDDGASKVKFEIDTVEFEKLHPFMQQKLVHFVINEVADSNKISREHIALVVELFGKQSGTKIDLPNAIVRRQSNKVYVYHSSDTLFECCEYEYSLKILDKWGEIPQNAYTKLFDYDKIKGDILVRNRLKNDEICIDKNGNHQSLNQYFKNEKIPQEMRDKIPLLCAGDQVLYVFGYRRCEGAYVDEQTKRVLQIEIWRK